MDKTRQGRTLRRLNPHQNLVRAQANYLKCAQLGSRIIPNESDIRVLIPGRAWGVALSCKLKSHKIQPETDKDVLSSSIRISQHFQLRSETVCYAPRLCTQHVIQPHHPCLAGAARLTLQDPSNVACSTLMRLTREFREQILFHPVVVSALH